MADKYANYAALAAAEKLGVDYQINTKKQNGAKSIIFTPHGGSIEAGTSEVVKEVAKGFHNWYDFAGIKPTGNTDLHITSTHFDEPQALQMLGEATHAMSLHGYSDSANAHTEVGGLDAELVEIVIQELQKEGFSASVATGGIAGLEPENITNRTSRGMGVQLELSTLQRQNFFTNNDFTSANRGNTTDTFKRYVRALRRAMNKSTAQFPFSQVKGGEQTDNISSKVDTLFREKATYVDNVAAMKSLSRLKDNDVVVTLGYYNSNDGGGATYVVKATAGTADEGAVVALSNGTQAHLVPAEFINYRQFGAKLDGDIARVSQETAAIKNAHAFANTRKLPVRQLEGTLTLNDTVIVQTSTNLNGCSVLTGSFCNNKTLFQINPTNSSTTVTGINQAQLTRGNNVIPSLANYKHQMINIVSDELLAVRLDGGTSVDVLKKDSFVLTRDGALVGNGLLHDFTKGNLTITARPFESSELVFEGLKIVWDFKNFSQKCRVINLDRGNSVLRNISLTIPNNIDYADPEGAPYKDSVIFIKNAYKVRVENLIGENITEGVYGSGYILQMDNVVDVTFDGVSMLNGWGTVGTNNVRDWKVYNSKVNRLDIHTTSDNLYCENVQFIGGWGVFLGYGDGKVILRDCTSDFSNIDGRTFKSVVYLGITYGLVYQGDIVIEDHVVKSRTTDNKYLVRCEFLGTGKDYKIAYDLKMPSVYVQGVFFEGTGTEFLKGYAIEGASSMLETLTNNTKKFIHPKNVSIQDVRFNLDNDQTYIQAYEVSLYGAIPVDTQGTDIVIRNIYQSIHSYYRTGFTTAQLATTDGKYLKRLIRINDTSANATSVSHSVIIENSNGTVWIECKTRFIKILNSVITAVDVEGTTGTTLRPDRFIIRGCDWYPMISTPNTQTLIQNPNLEARGNIIFPILKDGVELSMIEYGANGSAKLLQNNIISGTTATTELKAKYINYVNGY
jgi:phage replication-related protein YjqB (UPF0714/DUF867 family)